MKIANVPKKMSVVFGVNGQRQDLLADAVSGEPNASYNAGFPPITMIAKSAGGQAPLGKDFNQIFNELSADAQWNQASGIYPYDSDFSAEIGGYPKGSLVLGADGISIYQSLIDDNTYDLSSSNWSVQQLRVADLSSLRLTDPTIPGQRAIVSSRVSGWAATSYAMPWGGGAFIYVTNLPSSMQFDDTGSIIKTSSGKFWVRESLCNNNDNRMMVEWFLDSPPSFNVDASSNLQAASNAASLRSNSMQNTRKMKLVMPGALCINKTVTVYTRGVMIDGNNGWLQVDSSGSYTAYNTLSTNTNITSTPDGGATVKAAINLTHGSQGGVSNPAYSNQEFIKDLNIAYGSPSSASNIAIASLSDNGVAAICHWGTSTVGGAQGSFKNISIQGFGIGYINGDNVWGMDFYECKFVGCYIPMFLINGSDNTERYNLFGCVMQNGYRCIYSPWSGDLQIYGGSYVWNTGTYFHIPQGGNAWNLHPSRIERVDTTAPLIVISTSVENGGTSQNFPICVLSGTMILMDATSVLSSAYLFSVGKYCKLIVQNNTWSNKSMTNLANLKLLNPDDTAGQVIFNGNTCRVGIFSEMARDRRLLTSQTPAGRASDVTIGGANAANITTSVSTWARTFTVTTTASGTATILIRVPIDVDMTNWSSLSWRLNLTARTLSTAWNVNCYASITGTSYANNRVDLGNISITDATDISDICSLNSYGYRKILKRADGGWYKVPTEVYFYLSSTSQTAGDTITIADLGLLGY